jgi:hypothetical protein
MRFFSLAACSVVVCASLVGCSQRAPAGEGGRGERVASSAAAIQGGSLAPADTKYAVALVGMGLCSGTLIAPNLVITARHCVVDQPTESPDGCENGRIISPSDLRVTTAGDLGVNGGGPPPGAKIYGVSKILPAPKTNGCNPDMALVQLSSVVPASDTAPARPAVDSAYTTRPHFSDLVTAIGFGVDDQGNAGVRRYRTDIAVMCVPGDSQFSCPDVESQIQKFEFIAGEGACQGDSGGGLYDQTSYNQKKPVVVGVVSRGGVDDNGHCAEGVYERVDQFKEFIVTTARTAAQTGGYPVPDWADDGTPQPAPDAGPDPAPTVDAGAVAGDGGAAAAQPAGNKTIVTTTGCALAGRTAGTSSGDAWASLAGIAIAIASAGRRRRRRRR